MYNVYSFRRTQQAEADRTRIIGIHRRLQHRSTRLSYSPRPPLCERSHLYLNDSEEARRVEKEGCIPLLHPDLHNFRTDSSPSPRNIYLRTYQPAPTRADATALTFRNGHLSPAEPYNPSSPHNRVDWLRSLPPQLTLEKPDRSSKTHLNTSLTHHRYITADQPTLGAALRHNFRYRSKGLEISDQEFTPYNRVYKHDSVWAIPNPYSPERYIDGLEAIGNERKKREKEKEVAKGGFRPVGSKEPLLGQSLASKSIRSKKAEEFVVKFATVGRKRSAKRGDSYPSITDPSRATYRDMDGSRIS